MSRMLEVLEQDARQAGVPVSLDLTAIPQDVYECGPVPVSEFYDPYIDQHSLDELISEAKDPVPSVLLPWIIASGATVDISSAGVHFRAKPDLAYDETFFYGRMRIEGKRVVVRAVPSIWEQQDPRLGTPFVAIKEEGDFNLYQRAADGELNLLGTSAEAGDLGATCLKVVAYHSAGDPESKDTSITINPVQSCPLRCTFCRRQYDSLDESRKAIGKSEHNSLINIPPSEMARHLVERRYNDVDWGSQMQVSIVTGTFLGFDQMHKYIQSFSKAMSDLTGGGFDPAHREDQNIHIATHLLRTEDQMKRIRDAGVHSVQDTIEIINDGVRRDVMRKANPNDRRLAAKGELTFEDCLKGAEAGVKVFGPSGYYGALILGLDTYEDTIRGMKQLKDCGVTRLDPTAYQPIEKRGMALFRMSAADIVRSNLFYEQNFAAVSYAWPQPVEAESHQLYKK